MNLRGGFALAVLLIAPLAVALGATRLPRHGLDIVAGAQRGYLDANGAIARFNEPYGLAVDPQGYLFVADTYNHRIRRVAPDGAVTTLAGGGKRGIHGGGFADAAGGQARFRFPRDLALDRAGTLYVADTNNDCIRKLSPSGVVSTLAGGAPGYADGKATHARFHDPWGITVSPQGTVYVADTYNHRIRTISPDGQVATLAGSGASGFGGGGYEDGPGARACFNAPRGLALDAHGNLFVADAGNRCVREVTPDGTVSTVLGSPAANKADGFALVYPTDVAIASDGQLLVLDDGDQQVWKTSTDGRTEGLLAGLAWKANSLLFHAGLESPSSLVVDGRGRMLVADTGNQRICVIR